MTDDWYTRREIVEPSGRVYIVLTCRDCPGEVRLAKSGGGEQWAARLVEDHKPSGCCADRAAQAARQAT